MPSRPHPTVYAFALGHAVAGVWVFATAVAAHFEGWWTIMAVIGPLLVANAVGVAIRRDAVDRKISRGIAMTERTLGGLAVVVGALAMRSGLDGAWTVMGVSAAIGLWGVAYAWALERSDDAFVRA